MANAINQENSIRSAQDPQQKILKLKVTAGRSNQGYNIIFHTHNPNQYPLQIISYTFWFFRYDLDMLLKVSMERLNQGHIMSLHTYIYIPILPVSLPHVNVLYLKLSK